MDYLEQRSSGVNEKRNGWLTIIGTLGAAIVVGLLFQSCSGGSSTGSDDYECFSGDAMDRYGNFEEVCYKASDSVGISEVPTGQFENCDEARAYGAAPVYEGDPGFAPHLDRDGDGVGCEPWNEY